MKSRKIQFVLLIFLFISCSNNNIPENKNQETPISNINDEFIHKEQKRLNDILRDLDYKTYTEFYLKKNLNDLQDGNLEILESFYKKHYFPNFNKRTENCKISIFYRDKLLGQFSFDEDNKSIWFYDEMKEVITFVNRNTIPPINEENYASYKVNMMDSNKKGLLNLKIEKINEFDLVIKREILVGDLYPEIRI